MARVVGVLHASDKNMRRLRKQPVLSGQPDSRGGWLIGSAFCQKNCEVELAACKDTSNVSLVYEEVSYPPRRRGGPEQHSLRTASWTKMLFTLWALCLGFYPVPTTIERGYSTRIAHARTHARAHRSSAEQAAPYPPL